MELKYPKLSEDQVKRILIQIKTVFRFFKNFEAKFAEVYNPTDRTQTEGARKWRQRLQGGELEIPPDRMEGLIKALGISLEIFEAELLQEPGFCLRQYSAPFVKRLNDYFLQIKDHTESPAPIPSSNKYRLQPKADASKQTTIVDQAALANFFGPAMVDPEKSVQLVFPMRNPIVSPEKATAPIFEPHNLTFKFWNGEPQTNVHPEGVSGYLAFEDVRAATHITNFVATSTRTQKSISVRHENSRALESLRVTCTFVFGLGFTAATRETAEERFKSQLFSIYCDKARDGEYWTDYFALKYSSSRKKTAKNPKLRKIPPKPGYDIALIVRVIPEAEEGHAPNCQPYFLLSGRTAVGTAIAAYFLTKNWQELEHLYGKHNKDLKTDSLAVVIEHPEATTVDHDRTSPLFVEKKAAIHFWHKGKKKKCLAWA